jgi:hypothetical protein
LNHSVDAWTAYVPEDYFRLVKGRHIRPSSDFCKGFDMKGFLMPLSIAFTKKLTWVPPAPIV